MEKNIKRGDIYYAELNPVIGSEQGGTRPVLVISNNTRKQAQPDSYYCSYNKPYTHESETSNTYRGTRF